MAIDRERLRDILKRLGQALTRPTTLCLIGSTPGILAGQTDRNTSDIDVWEPRSKFNEDDFVQACRKVGLLYNPKGDLQESDIYVQIVEPGIVSVPLEFEPNSIASFGKLKVFAPPASAIAASKLVRAARHDIEDIGWWMRHRALTIEEIKTAIQTLPRKVDRETAGENLVFVQLIERKRP
jgi:hypothetical protein